MPGITAAAGCSAYAGIPLTHRDHAQAIQFVTGHCKRKAKSLIGSRLHKKPNTGYLYGGD